MVIALIAVSAIAPHLVGWLDTIQILMAKPRPNPELEIALAQSLRTLQKETLHPSLIVSASQSHNDYDMMNFEDLYLWRKCVMPLVGQPAPDFKVQAVMPDGDFEEVSLSKYKGKYVVLFFYPLDFTFVCPTEITAFSDRYSDFASRNTEILGVSVDSQYSHLAWINMDRKSGGLGELKYPLLADLNKTVAEAYDVLIPGEGIALRGLFIIDPDGVVQYATINNLNVGRSVDETLRILSAFQYTRQNPDQVCPAGWQDGAATMKPDPVASKEYFSKV